MTTHAHSPRPLFEPAIVRRAALAHTVVGIVTPSLFLPKRKHWIDARGAARGNKTCQCRYPHKHHGYDGDG